jgi:hypothetical protein
MADGPPPTLVMRTPRFGGILTINSSREMQPNAPSSIEPLMAVVENHDAGADEFCAPAENPANLDLLGDGGEPKPVVQRLGNPAVSLGNVAEVNAAMVIGHGVVITPIGGLADELKCLARSDVLIGIVAAIDPSGRFAPELCYPARVGPHAAFREQGQCVGPPLPLPDVLVHAARPDKERVDGRHRDEGPGH